MWMDEKYKLVNLVHREEQNKYNLLAVLRESDGMIFAINYIDTEFEDSGEVVAPNFEVAVYKLKEDESIEDVVSFKMSVKDMLLITEILSAGIRRVFDRLVKVAEILQDASKGKEYNMRIKVSEEQEGAANRFVR